MQELLSTLGRNIGIPELAFDEYHACCLALDNVILNLEWDAKTDMLFLYAHVGHLSANRESGLQPDDLYAVLNSPQTRSM